MPSIPKRVEDRLVAGLKKFQSVLAAAKARDVNESDTMLIVTDMLAEVFGYDKYAEITSELSIRSSFCDLALKLDGKCQTLIEGKAINTELKDNHLRQCIDYAANEGIDWAVLTNGIEWKIYKVIFAKPIDQELVAEFNFCTLSHREDDHLQLLFLLTREGWVKSAVGDYHTQRQALSRFYMGAAVLSDPVVGVIRRELKRLSPDVRIDAEQIRAVLAAEVIKRDVLDGEKATEAKKALARASAKSLRASKEADEAPAAAAGAVATASIPPAPLPTPAA